MSHDHSAHGHGHAPREFGAAFAAATALNVMLVAIQIIFGLYAHSLALLADAGHNLGDALGLIFAGVAYVVGRRRPTRSYTYGFGSASILAALANGVILLMTTGAIGWESIQRLFEPAEVASRTVIVVAAIAVAINGLAAWVLTGRQHDLNVRAAFLHTAADAAVSFGVVIAGAVIWLTGWQWVDPLVSLVISAVIVWSTWHLLSGAFKLALAGVPGGIDPSEVCGYLGQLPGVKEVHDLHIWAMSTTESALTCHLVMPDGHPGDAFISHLAHELHHRFRIEHPTIQIELGDATQCAFKPEHVV